MSHETASSSSKGSKRLLKPSNHSMTPNGGGSLTKVQKQIIRIKAQRDDVLVNMYIRIFVAGSHSLQILQLFSGESFNFQTSQVCPVDFQEEGRVPILPHDVSRNLHRAAELLFSNKAVANGLKGKYQARITFSNSEISFQVNSDKDHEAINEERLYYIAFIQISVPYASRPPKWPFIVQIPVARCLNNQLHFEGDDTCLDSDTVVEVDPPLLSKPIAPPLSRQNSTNTAVSSSDLVDDSQQSLSGPFYSTSSLTLRWARADAGKLINGTPAAGGLTRIGGDMLKISAAYSNPRQLGNQTVEMDIEAKLNLLGASCPSLDATATLGLSLVGAVWLPDTVSVLPSMTQDATVFHSFSTTRSMTSPLDVKKSPIQQFGNTNGQRGSSNKSYLMDQEHSDLDTTLDEDNTILNVRPPRGLVSSEMESESDDDYPNSSPSKRQADRRRRYSLGGRASAKDIEVTNDLITKCDQQDLLHILLKTAPLSLGSGNFTCHLRGKAHFKLHESTFTGMVVELPHIRAAGILLHYEASIRGVGCQIIQHGSHVRMANAEGAARYDLELADTLSESQETSVLARIDIPHQPIVCKTSPSSSESESLESFANTSLQTERNLVDVSKQASQIESLRGIIQQVSVEIAISAIQPGDPLLSAEDSIRRIRTTHTIKATWPSSPAPSSSWLPEMVFAIPMIEGCDLQVLYAGVNGLCADVREDTEQIRRGTSRMVDLKLPLMLKQALKVDVFLLYTQESDEVNTFCAFPLIASSIAELIVKIDCQSLPMIRPIVEFALSPLHLYHDVQDSNSNSRSQITALMLPSMTNVSLTMVEKATSPLAIIATDPGPLRRSTVKATTKGDKKWSLLHLLLTVILAITIGFVWQNVEPLFDLQGKVDSLALALNVDFSEGSWTPEAASSSSMTNEQVQSYLSPEFTQADVPVRHVRERLKTMRDPHALSTETRSYFQILQSIPIKVGRVIFWPLHLLYQLIY